MASSMLYGALPVFSKPILEVDSLPSLKKLLIDSTVYKIDVESLMPALNLITDEELQIRRDIQSLKETLQKENDRYYKKIHQYFPRFLKMEATDALLSIHYYRSSAKRLHLNKTGLQFQVVSSFPPHLSHFEISQSTQLLVNAFIESLNRFERIHGKTLHQLNSTLQILIASEDFQLNQTILHQLDLLKIDYRIIVAPHVSEKICLELVSEQIFLEDYNRWIFMERKIQRDIRILVERLKH